jgi:hypothetical protein
LTIYLALLACRGDIVKELIIVYIIKNENPLPSLLVPEPILDQFEYVGIIDHAYVSCAQSRRRGMENIKSPWQVGERKP